MTTENNPCIPDVTVPADEFFGGYDIYEGDRDDEEDNARYVGMITKDHYFVFSHYLWQLFGKCEEDRFSYSPSRHD